MLLARYRSGMARQAAHPVHLIQLPVRGEAGAVSALCGMLLAAAELETVTPGQGAPCTLCFLAHLSGGSAGSAPPQPATTMPVDTTGLLATRRCRAPMLVHPSTPAYRILLTGEPYGIPLPWPDEVRIATGHLPLPPTRTATGPVSWAQLHHDHMLGCCREIDVFGALHTLTQRHWKR